MILGFVLLAGTIGLISRYYINNGEDIPYNQFMNYVEQELIEKIEFEPDSDTFSFETKDGRRYKTENPRYDNFKKEMLDKGIDVTEKRGFSNYSSLFSILISCASLVLIFNFIEKATGGNSDVDKNWEKNNRSNISFKNVAGLKEVKCDLMTTVDFLVSPEKYKKAGAKLPKGIIFYGPPGTGKTLLAKAVAGEAKVGFRAVNGSDFMEKYVGVGAERIRKLFAWAKKNMPCIIFIDEIDAIGGKRGHSDSENRQTLNALLGEMDGFKAGNGVIVIAATNRLQDLDPALIRPGRFDSHFSIPIPITVEERKEVIDIYSQDKTFGPDVNLDDIAKESLGFSPADIEVVLNEAAILSVRENNGIISKKILDDALFKKIMKGHAKKDSRRRTDEIELTAWHEAGHALVGVLLGHEVSKVTIIPSTSGAGGVTFFNRDRIGMVPKKELEEEIMIFYAGRASESLHFGKDKVTTGASEDIKMATSIIDSMIKSYGMSSFGLLDLEEMQADNDKIMAEANRIQRELYDAVEQMLKDHITSLETLANKLIEQSTLSKDEIEEIIGLNNSSIRVTFTEDSENDAYQKIIQKARLLGILP